MKKICHFITVDPLELKFGKCEKRTELSLKIVMHWLDLRAKKTAAVSLFQATNNSLNFLFLRKSRHISTF